MASRHPIRAAIAGAAIPAVAIAAFGNQWFTEHVRLEAKTALKRRMVDNVGGPFQWRLTPHRGGGGGGLWAAQILGVVVVIALTFLIAWLVARSASSGGVLIGVWGGTVLATMVAFGLFLLASYDAVFGGFDRQIEPGLNAFWYSVFHSPDAALWGAMVGLVAGCAALLFSGGSTTATPIGPAAPTWGAAPPSSGAPVSGVGPTADVPPAPWTAVPPRDRPTP